MELIQNDRYGIECSVAYETIKKAIHPFIGKFKKGISKEKTLKATNLNIFTCDTTNLDFLKFFPNLKQFSLCSNKLLNLDALAQLPALNAVFLFNILTDNINFIKKMPQLRYVHFDGIKLKDYTPIQGHPNIETLHLENCELTEINFLTDMPKLQWLSVINNKIKDFSPLKEFKELKYIGAINNGVSQEEITKWVKELHCSHIEF